MVIRSSSQPSASHRATVVNPLAMARYVWSFASLRAPGPRGHYDYRRAEDDRHSSAPRRCLFNCLQKHKTYDESAAFPHRRSMRLSHAS
ncbi:hypothetical protein [Streptosporangium amethystogenes]|uniref:hypothetical protein n=1 Tax=Streptosporangium amethystogenes TaxID=2002 RepID=UPI00056CF80E|nr:hypothetical protein [Streptosporangium amethystogenes]